MNIYEYKARLDSDKLFRDSERGRLILLRNKSHNNKTLQDLCNLVLTYIYDLDWKAVFNQNNKNI